MPTAPQSTAVEQCENCGETTQILSELDAKDFLTNRVGRSDGSLNICPRCKTCCDGRKNATANIVASLEPKKLIVAGPGTGKTWMFSSLLQNASHEKPSLVFTLINNLVDELVNELGKLENDQIKINTLHGFCKELLHRTIRFDDITADFEYYPELPTIVEADADFLDLKFSEADFRRAFANLKHESEALIFFLHQAAYYNAVSHNDSVYRVAQFYRDNAEKVPSFEIVIVDEYQDFNLSEKSLIDSLADKNSVVIAGDDDQSLYHFRDASNEYIRELWKRDDFKKFSLPFCSRCTPVLVDATNAFIMNVQRLGLLKGRIPRAFECYWPDKYREHNAYPRILVANCSKLNTVCEFVRQRILEITEQEKLNGTEKDLQFIVVGPESGYHIQKVKELLSVKLDSKLFELDFAEKKEQMIIEQGYSIIKKGNNSNLGWRIVLNCDPLPNAATIIKACYETGVALVDMLPADYLAKHKQVFNAEAKVVEAEEVQEAPKRIRIKLTNFYGCKGLSALHAIVIGLNDYVFPKDPDQLQNDDVCKFLVALTRAKRSCCLVHNGEFRKALGYAVNAPSTYIQLLPNTAIERRKFKIKAGRLLEC
jgi:superfamily I DNA/RNA helicase